MDFWIKCGFLPQCDFQELLSEFVSVCLFVSLFLKNRWLFSWKIHSWIHGNFIALWRSSWKHSFRGYEKSTSSVFWWKILALFCPHCTQYIRIFGVVEKTNSNGDVAVNNPGMSLQRVTSRRTIIPREPFAWWALDLKGIFDCPLAPDLKIVCE